MTQVSFRRATVDDEHACFVLFRTSLHHSMLRHGYLPADSPPPDLDELWPRQQTLSTHVAGVATLALMHGYLPFDPCLFL